MQKRKKHTGAVIVLSIVAVLIITVVVAAAIYSRFVGFGTGDCVIVADNILTSSYIRSC